MKPMLFAGIALMMAGALPTTGYHFEGHGETSEATYTIGATEPAIVCESYGMTDPVNGGLFAHGGVNGMCYMSTNVGVCTPGIPTPLAPIPADNCSHVARPVGT